MSEVYLAAMLCGFLAGGETEVPQQFNNLGLERRVRIDCETPTHVVEIGLDNKASSRDSIHQAIFGHLVTGKIPMVIVIDTDGVEDRYQQEIRMVAKYVGVEYATCTQAFIEAWAALAGFRQIGTDKTLNDLPRNASYESHCNLGASFRVD